MRTTINIHNDLMDMLLDRTKAKTKTKAVEIAIKEYIEKKSIEDLISLSGKINIDLDWEKEEEAELNEYQDHS
ncbi:MAG: type II toxin-antitoxin system VapB family antitoxin [Deltaproteobacteria bacterium]|nr:type II toxin-antitoxin system VapB family antitoxin [Deltaproteobacteria bacterium]MBW1728047.1 type II toxin-antitoxin system VapB family antitoxin [Deltaproteobacteria bacterium]MBW1910952.1 type II toxin-antitoxin system VapB family antitoxin [Deltaproteobacteria bacterium]MBW2034980.1 type II toxin-antitoxin system VapB family antitoxin [Deltaproteobacteria bacterium]MBW2115813.1 type II toxin-antitoxin system VapB family antitoxin [Deltaproteobacteria bacterium]